MIRRPTRSTRTDTLFPYTTLFRSGCPAIGEIGPAEVGARQHEFIVAGTSIVGIDPAMDMHDSAKIELAPWVWKPGRIAAFQRRIAFLEQQVEIGGDQTCNA